MNERSASISLLFLLLSSCVGVQRPLVATRCSARIDAAELQSLHRAAVVRVDVGQGSGTGFLIRPRQDELLVVTNYHVVEGGSLPTIEFDSGLRVQAPVVRASLKHDLALLKLPGRLDVATAAINETPPVLGQHILVLGFPGVQNSRFALTAEEGAVTSLERTIGNTRYIQTNANINPGNSGGPAFDACGTVVGVVVAKVRTTERTNLLIPNRHLVQLVSAQLRGERSARVAVREVLDDFFQKLAFGETVDAARDHLSRRFLEEVMAPFFRTRVERVMAKVTRLRVIAPGASAQQLLQGLDEDERLILAVVEMLKKKQVSVHNSLRAVFPLYAASKLAGVQDVELEEVRARGSVARVIADVRLSSGYRQRMLLEMEKELGRWSIAHLSIR